MEPILILRPYLRKMSDGNFFRTLFAWVLRVKAGLTVIGILYASVKLEGLVRGEHAPASLYLGLLIVQLALLVLAIIIVNILLIRAEDIGAAFGD